jgi:hypothetical protein
MIGTKKPNQIADSQLIGSDRTEFDKVLTITSYTRQYRV